MKRAVRISLLALLLVFQVASYSMAADLSGLNLADVKNFEVVQQDGPVTIYKVPDSVALTMMPELAFRSAVAAAQPNLVMINAEVYGGTAIQDYPLYFLMDTDKPEYYGIYVQFAKGIVNYKVAVLGPKKFSKTGITKAQDIGIYVIDVYGTAGPSGIYNCTISAKLKTDKAFGKETCNYIVFSSQQ